MRICLCCFMVSTIRRCLHDVAGAGETAKLSKVTSVSAAKSPEKPVLMPQVKPTSSSRAAEVTVTWTNSCLRVTGEVLHRELADGLTHTSEAALIGLGAA